MVDFYLPLAYTLAYIGLIATSFYVINLVFYYRKKDKIAERTDFKVSIIIPAFNEEKSIERTIKSALALDYPKENLEIIVVDDGSRDKTYEIAKACAKKSAIVKVFTKKNGGKATALNLGIEKAKGEIVVSMDADSFVREDALKRMVSHFSNKEVMCVAPSMGVYNPSSLWGRIVQIEYYMGVFLRKSFASMNAVHITPGAFSVYRKSFFEKYGGYDVGNLTEDLEVALRIQKNRFRIENEERAAAYTLSPESFKALLIQRRRWYIGLVKNLWNYRSLFGFKNGPLGSIVLPVAVITVVCSVFLTSYLVSKLIVQIKDEIIQLNSINFNFYSSYELNQYFFKNLTYTLLSHPLFILSVLFVLLLAGYMKFSRAKMQYSEGIKLNFVLFVALYSFLFAFWWLISFFYLIFFGGNVSWRTKKNGA